MRIPRDPNRRPPPVHPGEILREDFLLPLGLSANALALGLRVPATRISQIVHERRGITADTACRLGLYFGTGAELWMNLQKTYELSLIDKKVMAQIESEVQRGVA